MALSELVGMRIDFTQAVARLVTQAAVLGTPAALLECKRSDEQAIINAYGQLGRGSIATALSAARFYDLSAAILNNGAANGIRNSLHEVGLAVDLALYKDGDYLTGLEDYRPLGEWWERADPRAAWGGRFGDADHFSFKYQGRK